MMACLLSSLGGCTLVGFAHSPLIVNLFTVVSVVRLLVARAGVLLGCENLFHKGWCVLLNTSADEYPGGMLEILFRWCQDFNGMWSSQIRCLWIQDWTHAHSILQSMVCLWYGFIECAVHVHRQVVNLTRNWPPPAV